MPQSQHPFAYETTESLATEDQLGNFLSPEQRLDAIADILATLAYRAIKNDDDKQPFSQ